MPARGRRGPRRSRRPVVALFTALALIALVGLLIGRIVGGGEILRSLEESDPHWLPLCLAGEVVSFLGYVLAYRATARLAGGPDLAVGLAARVALLGAGGTVLAATPGGLAVDYWALHEAGASRDDAVKRVLALNTAKWLALGVAAAVSGSVVAAGLVSGPPAPAYAWLTAVTASVALAAWLSGASRAGRLTEPAVAGAEPSWPGRASAFVRRALADAIGGVVYVRRLVAAPRANVGAFVGFPLYWAGDVICLYAALRAFDVSPEPVRLLLAYATGYAATALPLPLGGSGGVEAAMTYSLHAAGVELAPALLAVAAYRFFGFWAPLVPALVMLSAVRRVEADLARVRRRAGRR